MNILGVFGSYARKEQSEASDVDILVEIERPIGLKFFKLWDELEELLGTKVDLLTTRAVRGKPLLWESVKEDLEAFYRRYFGMHRENRGVHIGNEL